MKRALILTILLITLLFAPFGVISARTPVLTLEDTVVEYSPDGYMPQAEVSMPELAEKINIWRWTCRIPAPCPCR